MLLFRWLVKRAFGTSFAHLFTDPQSFTSWVSWYSSHVDSIKQSRISHGYTADRFRPNQNIENSSERLRENMIFSVILIYICTRRMWILASSDWFWSFTWKFIPTRSKIYYLLNWARFTTTIIGSMMCYCDQITRCILSVCWDFLSCRYVYPFSNLLICWIGIGRPFISSSLIFHHETRIVSILQSLIRKLMRSIWIFYEDFSTGLILVNPSGMNSG